MSAERFGSQAEALTRSATIELVVHVAVLAFVLFPLLAIVFPALLMLVAATMLASSQSSTMLSAWIATAGNMPLAVTSIAALIAGLIGAFAGSGNLAAKAKLRELTGANGEKLACLTRDIWLQMGGNGLEPTLRWFPAMDVAAYAAMNGGRPEIQLSAGLWQAAVSGDPIARAILAHELAHLRYKDSLLLAVLLRLGAAIRTILIVTGLSGLVVIANVLVVETRHMLAANMGVIMLIGSWLSVLAAASIVLILVPLAWLAVQRQIAFITSLIEMRADIAGAAFTEGLRQATQLFATHEGIERSGGRAFFSALISPRLTHIPERERLAILSAPDRVITPKIWFFAFSVLLIFLLPINFASPLFLGGAANHLAMLAMATSFNCASVLMLMAGRFGSSIPIPCLRLLALALTSIVVTALPRINLEPLSYLAMSWLAGFGGESADWSSLPHDVAVTFDDLAGKFAAGLFNLGALMAVGLAFASLAILLMASRWSAWAPISLRLATALILIVLGTAVAGYDPFRTMSALLVESLVFALDESGLNPSILLCLPLLLPAISEGIFALAGGLAGAAGPQRSGP